MALELSSTAFASGETIPKQFTGDGKNISPPLKWTDPPAATRSLALVCEDPDAPRGIFTHWVMFNMPATLRELEEGVSTGKPPADGAIQGKNDFGNVGYGGPAPPRGKPHRYFFKLLALDQPLDLQGGATKDKVLAAANGHVLGETELMGTYQR